ncbi:hypothetical protein D3N36_28540 (plasmid) [Klebsiella pneumoniae]|nr:hypothetical protein D3N36_28540 [Klebsiella pneumoniae]
MMSLWDALRMNMMISYQELVRTFPSGNLNIFFRNLITMVIIETDSITKRIVFCESIYLIRILK